MHIIPYSNPEASFRGTFSNDFLIFQIFRRGYPGTVGWPVAITESKNNNKMRLKVDFQKYIELAKDETKLLNRGNTEIGNLSSYLTDVKKATLKEIELIEEKYDVLLAKTTKFVEFCESLDISLLSSELDSRTEKRISSLSKVAGVMMASKSAICSSLLTSLSTELEAVPVSAKSGGTRPSEAQ